MVKIILAEYQKLKRTFTKRLIWLAPAVTLLLCAVLGAGEMFQNGCYNWWYTMLLPGALTLFCAGVIQKDKKKLDYRGILGLPIRPAKIWVGKTGTCILLYFISCLVFFTGVTLGGLFGSNSISPVRSAAASGLLFLTFLWQIPLCMFLADKFGVFASVFINVAGNVMGVVFAARTSFWWIPYAIPSRLMCPVINVLPNGLSVPANDPLLATNVILPGVVITVLLFFVLSTVTALPYRKLEAK